MGIDYSKISPDLQEKIKGWEANNPVNKQLVKLNDIASILQDVSNVIDYRGKQSDEALKQLGTVLTDAREQLVALNAKEAPEAPDTSQPVIDAISKLEKALTVSIKTIDTKPVVNVPKADAPVVNVDAPSVTVDNREIAKLLKTDIPQAFDKAIKSIVIPKTDTTATNQLLKDLAEKLDSIDTGVRLKPQAPNTIGINNTVANPVPVTGEITGIASTVLDPLDGYNTNNIDDADPYYFGLQNASGAWVIKKLDTGVMTYAKGTSGYATAWTNRATQSYDTFDNTFDPVVGSVITSATNITSTIQAADSASIDAFSRWRVSEPNYVFDTNFQYDLQPLVYEAITAESGATVTHDATNRNALMTFSSTPTGGKAYMQTYEWFRYQAGRSQLVFQTFNFIETKADTLKFVGYGNGNNGIELQLNGSTLQLTLYSDTDKGDETVTQSNWNIDKMDGTGASGITLDVTKTHIFVIDFQWLGVGRVRCGVDIDGVLYYIHEFKHANIQTVAYMQTANLPLRAGMTCTGTVSTTMRYICASISSEGGETDIGGYNFSVEGTATAGSGARTHLLSLRPNTTFNSIANRSKFVLESVELLVTGNSPIEWEIVLGQAISGTTAFTDVNATYSGMEYNTAGTISGSPALVIASGYVAPSTQSKTTSNRTMANKYPITLDAAGAVRSMGTISIIVTGLGGSSACRAVMNWREIR